MGRVSLAETHGFLALMESRLKDWMLIGRLLCSLPPCVVSCCVKGLSRILGRDTGRSNVI